MDREEMRRSLLKIFKNEKIELVAGDPPEVSKNECFLEIETPEVLGLCVPFARAYFYENIDTSLCKENLVAFMEGIVGLGLVEDSGKDSPFEYPELVSSIPSCRAMLWDSGQPEKKSLLGIMKNTLNGIYDRSDRIYLFGRVRDFRWEYIDWEDREFSTQMIEYLFCRSLLMFRSTSNEHSMRAVPDDGKAQVPRMSAWRMQPCGHLNELYREDPERAELLRRRLAPGMTLSEYADFVTMDLRRRERQKTAVREDGDSEEELRSRRKEDDLNDSRRNFRGNTRNVG